MTRTARGIARAPTTLAYAAAPCQQPSRQRRARSTPRSSRRTVGGSLRGMLEAFARLPECQDFCGQRRAGGTQGRSFVDRARCRVDLAEPYLVWCGEAAIGLPER